MANFRMERMFVMLDEPVPGLDHLKAVDRIALAWHGTNALASQLDVRPLDDFAFAPFDKPRWHEPSKALKTIAALLLQLAAWRAAATNPLSYSAETLDEKIGILTRLQDVLQTADSFDRRFYFAAKDLA